MSSVNHAEDLGPITFDPIGKRLIAASHSGKSYANSTTDGSNKLLAADLGWVSSVAASQQHIPVASGKKVLSLARSHNHRENPPRGCNPSLEDILWDRCRRKRQLVVRRLRS